MRRYQQIAENFEQIGARAHIRPLGKGAPDRYRRPMAIDVIPDGWGEYFDIQIADEVRLATLDVRPRDRHLLLAASNLSGEDKFLCGHDERHWFTAAIPQEPEIADIAAAKQALKPDLVRTREKRKRRGKHPRRSDVFMRQGEWFFIPWAHARIDPYRVLCNGNLIREPGSE